MLPTFRVEFDAGKGPAAFRRRWHPESPSSALWGMLERLFSLGGTFYSETLFALPYVYTQFPAELDPLGHVVAVKAGTRLLDRPGQDGKPVETLDYAIIPLAERLRPPVMITTGRYFEVQGAAGRAVLRGGSGRLQSRGTPGVFREARRAVALDQPGLCDACGTAGPESHEAEKMRTRDGLPPDPGCTAKPMGTEACAQTGRAACNAGSERTNCCSPGLTTTTSMPDAAGTTTASICSAAALN